MNVVQQSITQQQIETNVRMALGDLQLQLIMANAKIAELEAQVRDLTPPEPKKANGKDKPDAPGDARPQPK